MMSTVVKRVVTSFGFKTKWSRCQSAAFRVLVDRNGKQSYPVMNIEALAFQKRFESDSVAPTMTLSNHLSSEIASEEDSAPSEEFKSIVNLIEKTFKIHDEPGRGFVTLTRSFKNESIEIVFNCQDEGDYDDHDETRNDSDEDDDDADEKEEEEEPYGINFKVIITKNGGDKMILQCAAFDRVNINGVRYVPAGSASSDKLLYAGPVFDHLDGELYKAFYSYLADRAIDDDLANFITSYSLEKEQNEYANWLQHLADFTAEEREGIV